MSTISVNEIRHVFDLIIDKLIFEANDNIEMTIDAYQFVPTSHWDSFASLPIHSGSLADDIESLKKLTSNPDRPCTYVDFDRMASVLRAISQVYNPEPL